MLPVTGLFAQDNEHMVRDLKCYNQSAFRALDLLLSSRETGDYEVLAEWSEKVSSNKIVNKIYPLEGAFQYVIILTTEEGIDGSAIEIRDAEGNKIEYVSRIDDLDKSQINFFFTPPVDDIYQISFRVVNGSKPTTCMYMAIMKGEKDPLEE